MYVNNWIFHIIKNPANIETLPTEPPRIKYGKPSKFFPLFINICVHLLQSSVTPLTHKLFLSKDVLEKKFNPFSRPQAAISWLFSKISASIIDYPRFSSSSILLPIIFPWFSRILLFLAELVCRAKMYHAVFQPDCVAIDCSG